jgi:hypothetical protein
MKTKQTMRQHAMNSDRQDDKTFYLIKVEGQLDESWTGWFSDLTVTYEDGISTLAGHVADQAALRGVLTKIWDLNLTLLSVARIEPPFKHANAQET